MELATLTTQIATVSERYADAFGIRRSEDWAVITLADELGELTQAHLRRSGQARVAAGVAPEALQQAFEDELADVVGMALVLASLARWTWTRRWSASGCAGTRTGSRPRITPRRRTGRAATDPGRRLAPPDVGPEVVALLSSHR